jgi:protein SPT2
MVYFLYLESDFFFVSARIAKREDMLAIQEEERHEEEKRKRKREKERATARWQ